MLVDSIFSLIIKIKSKSTKSTNSYLEKPSHTQSHPVTPGQKRQKKVGLYDHIRSASGHFFLIKFFFYNQMSNWSGLDEKKIALGNF
jgi:hypothetical protein